MDPDFGEHRVGALLSMKIWEPSSFVGIYLKLLIGSLEEITWSTWSSKLDAKRTYAKLQYVFLVKRRSLE